MKIISCASYFGTGSSAITDLISEYSSVYSLSNYEFRFAHDIDGISDLEFHLVENHNRHNSGHALKRFIRLSSFNAGTWFNSRYEPFFDNQYMKITNEYVEKLTDFTYPGHWFYDLYDKGKLYYYVKQLQNKVLRKFLSKRTKGILPNELIYCSNPGEEKFLEYTKEYTEELLRVANKDNSPFLMVDQIVPSSNLQRYLRYFNDISVFVVDRDPRDIFTLEKHYWKTHIFPTNDAKAFCDWYKYTRIDGERGQTNSKKVMCVQFEDLIYKYSEKVEQIETLLGLLPVDHSDLFLRFNPRRSVKNTETWKDTNDDRSIDIIERTLPEYLYDFDEARKKSIAGTYIEESDIF